MAMSLLSCFCWSSEKGKPGIGLGLQLQPVAF